MPFHENADPRRAVLILIDGARPDVLQTLLDRGDLPHLARWVIEPGGITTGTTVFPSTTGVAYIPLLFGRYPGALDVPGIRWLDRAGAAGGALERWRAARSYCGPQAGWINRDIAPAPSLFDLIGESLAVCTPITRGLRPGAHLIPLTRAALGATAHFLGTHAALDRAVAAAWLAAAPLPWRFLFVVFPGPDGFTHLHDPWHPAVLESYRRIDRALGRFVASARRRGELPAFFVTSDHGASAVREHCDVAVALEQWGVPTMRHPLHLWRRGAQAAVMVSGNGCAHVYFTSSDRDLAARLVRRLLELPAVRLGAFRDPRGGVIVARGGCRGRLSEQGSGIRYEAWLGDPLGLGVADFALGDRDMLERSRGTDLPDAPRQLLQLFRSARAGDLVLAGAPGADFRGPWEIPAHRSGHGSLLAAHMQVPIAASIPLPPAALRTVDLMPTILETLGVESPRDLDGVSFSQLGAAEGVIA
jgi:type I phosphodiesterase/nucleotide pyrophosphatase